jgi:hypothetical protein
VNDRITAQRDAMRHGLQLRRSLSIPRDIPINIFDIATSIGVEVQFLDLPSLEGMFYRGPDPKVILPSIKHRPRGRVAFSCAHELGHFDLGHGTRVDEYIESDRVHGGELSLEELAADTFASTVLMPRPAVIARFECRGWDVNSVSEIGLIQIATELDVGYTTLCTHLHANLELVDSGWLKKRSKFTPKELRNFIAPHVECRRLVLLDQHWPKALPIDLEVGDCLAIPVPLVAKLPPSLQPVSEHDGRSIFRAVTVGEMPAYLVNQRIDLRIARKGYCGLLKYRYEEEVEEI